MPHSQNDLKIKLINTLWEAVLPSTQTSHILKHPLLLCFRHNTPTQPLSDNWQRRILGNHVVCVCRLVQTYPTASLPWLSQTHTQSDNTIQIYTCFLFYIWHVNTQIHEVPFDMGPHRTACSIWMNVHKLNPSIQIIHYITLLKAWLLIDLDYCN